MRKLREWAAEAPLAGKSMMSLSLCDSEREKKKERENTLDLCYLSNNTKDSFTGSIEKSLQWDLMRWYIWMSVSLSTTGKRKKLYLYIIRKKTSLTINRKRKNKSLESLMRFECDCWMCMVFVHLTKKLHKFHLNSS